VTSPAVILIGPPGAGKSTIGPLLADELGVAFTDTDTMVEQMAGKAVSDIFVSDGEAVFRDLERTAVARGVASHPGVLALGGGAVMDADTQRLLRGQRVVYLATGFAAAVHRTGLSAARPLLLGNPRARLKELLAERVPVYESLAWITVSTDDREPQEIADEIAETIAARIAADAGEGAGVTPGEAGDVTLGWAGDVGPGGAGGVAPGWAGGVGPGGAGGVGPGGAGGVGPGWAGEGGGPPGEARPGGGVEAGEAGRGGRVAPGEAAEHR
jgi:shikimate kinase